MSAELGGRPSGEYWASLNAILADLELRLAALEAAVARLEAVVAELREETGR